MKYRVNKIRRGVLLTTAITAALGSSAYAGTSGDMVTISLSGSTAIRNFIVNAGATVLEPIFDPNTFSYTQTSITFSNGIYNSGTSGTGLQLAPQVFTNANLANGSTGPGIRFEWHQQGSVEGILELAQDQVGAVTNLVAPRSPTVGNSIVVSRNTFTGTVADPGSTFDVPNQTETLNGYKLSQIYPDTHNTPVQTQSPVTIAITDVKAAQGFAISTGGTTPAIGSKPWNLKPGNTGYGVGNTGLPTGGLGQANANIPLNDQTILNNTGLGLTSGVGNLTNTEIAKTATVFGANPGTGLTRLNRTDAQWLQLNGRLANGVDFNVTTRDVGSGTRNVITNNTGVDPAWGGGEFDAGNGNDPTGGSTQTFVGPDIKFSNKSAGGDELRPTLRNARMAVGTISLPDIRAGNGAGTAASPNNVKDPLRALEYADSLTDPVSNPTDANAPDSVDGNAVVVGTQWARVSLKNIISGAYTISQNETFATFNDPARPGKILGDPNDDALTYRSMITSSVAAFPAGSLNGPASALGGQGFIVPNVSAVDRSNNGTTTHGNDGDPLVANPSFNASLAYAGVSSGTGTFANPAGDSYLGDPNFNNKFDVSAPGLQKSGGAGNGTKYGDSRGNLNQGINPINLFNTTITITESGANGGNWFFGNFNQNGSRDLAAVKTALFANLALEESGFGKSSLLADDSNVAHSNNATINWASFTASHSAALSAASVSIGALQAMTSQTTGGTGANKGDLVVMGDFNSDGKFDGKDLYLLAHGAAVSDAHGTGTAASAGYGAGTLTLNAYNATTGAGGFGDAIRSAVIRKNDALDFMDTYATSSMKTEASPTFSVSTTGTLALPAPAGATTLSTTTISGVIYTNYSYDSTGSNAFRKEDVNRDGLVDLNDALTVDHFNGKSYASLDDQVGATVKTDGQPRLFSLVDAKLIDGDNTTIGSTDVAVINTRLTGTGTSKWFTGTVTKDGANTVTFARTAGTTVVVAGASLSITAGNLTVNGSANPFVDNSGGATNGTKLPINVSSTGTLQLGGGVKQLGSLTATSGGTVTVESTTAGHNVLSATSLTISGTPAAPTAKVTLGSKADLVIQSGYTVDQTRQLIHAAYNNGTWDASGIAVTTPVSNQALGFATGANFAAINGTHTVDGVTLSDTDVFVKYTYTGDADLSGYITINDYALLDAGFFFQPTGATWTGGDFNYDGVVTYLDYALIDAAFIAQGGQLAGDMIALHTFEFGPNYLAAFTAAVPEPASLLLLGVGTLGLLRRRR